MRVRHETGTVKYQRPGGGRGVESAVDERHPPGPSVTHAVRSPVRLTK
jgi:hypothetical protein